MTSKSFEQTILQTIKENNLITYGDTIVVGVSGGVDSVVLLTILNKFQKRFGATIKVAHVNHGIRKETAVRDETFVKDLCKKMDLEYHLLRENIPLYAKQHKQTEEEAGREVRYAFFEKLAGKSGKIATAHHANDNAETMLMNLMNGTGLNGICGIQIKRDNIIRPLLYLSKEQIYQYAQDNQLSYVEDETNEINDYTRNKIRNVLIPLIEKEFNPSFVKSSVKSIQYFTECNQFVEGYVEKAVEDVVVKNTAKEVRFDVDKFTKLDDALQGKVLLKVIGEFSKNNRDSRPVAIREVKKLFSSTDCSSLKTKTLYFFKKGNILTISRQTENLQKLEINTKEKQFIFCGVEYLIEKTRNKPKTIPLNTCYIPVEYENDLVIRYPAEEDMVMLGSKNRTKASKYFKKRGLSPQEKNMLPVIASGKDIFWIFGLLTTKQESEKKTYIKISVLQ